MEEDRQRLTLETFQDGALIEQFDRALDRVFDNLADINTTTKPREITMIVKITPNNDRTFLEISGGVRTKFAGQHAVKSTADLSVTDKGRPVAYNRQRKQMDLPFNVTRLTDKGGDQ
jgi:hypothetical protein